MEYQYLHTIQYPCDLKALPKEALPRVCDELRDFIIQQLSQNPGHLGSSLGTVELTVALHYVFDTPNDQLVWDVGHQAYAHKILTGRRERFHTNRQFKGIAPFPTPAESEYDAFIAGHASNSISAALGIAIGEEARGEDAKKRVVAILLSLSTISRLFLSIEVLLSPSNAKPPVMAPSPMMATTRFFASSPLASSPMAIPKAAEMLLLA